MSNSTLAAIVRYRPEADHWMSHFALATLAVFAIFLGLHAAAVNRPRLGHPAKFAELGKPEPLHSDLSASSWTFAGYMFRCGFLRQGDVVLAVIGCLWYASAVLLVAVVWFGFAWQPKLN